MLLTLTLFSLQLSDSAGEEDPADLKRAQKGKFGEVLGSLWGKGIAGPLSQQQLILKVLGGFPGSGLLCSSGSKSSPEKNSEDSTPFCRSKRGKFAVKEEKKDLNEVGGLRLKPPQGCSLHQVCFCFDLSLPEAQFISVGSWSHR